MNHPTKPRQSRREMFRSSVRYLALGGVSLVCGRLILKVAESPAEESCRRPLACRDCAALAECRLAEALAAKKCNRR